MNKVQKFFSFDWLFSETRKEIKQAIEELKQKDKPVNSVQEPIQEKITKATYFSGNNITVVLQDGDTLMAEGDVSIYERVKNAKTKQELLEILYPPKYEEENVVIAKNDLAILEVNDDFEVVGTNVYLKPCKLPLPEIIKSTFIEILEKRLANSSSFIRSVPDFKEKEEEIEELNKSYESLKMFWYWLALNPIDSAREDALRFVKENNVPITKNGLLVTFRKVVSKNDTSKNFEYISSCYLKLKQENKDPKMYFVYKNNGLFTILHKYSNKKFIPKGYTLYGQLETIYNNFFKEETNIYTDNHTKSKKIVFGEIYKEDEDNVDLDNSRDCSKGLHSGSVDFGEFDSFGDVGAICLLNPSKIRSVPLSNAKKLRSSELFMVCPTDFQNYKEIVESNKLLDFSSQYSNQTMEELLTEIKNKKFDKFSCQNYVVNLSIPEIETILKEKIVNIK